MSIMIAITTAIYSILIGTETIKINWNLDDERKKKRLRFLLILGIVMIILAVLRLFVFLLWKN